MARDVANIIIDYIEKEKEKENNYIYRVNARYYGRDYVYDFLTKQEAITFILLNLAKHTKQFIDYNLIKDDDKNIVLNKIKNTLTKINRGEYYVSCNGVDIYPKLDLDNYSIIQFRWNYGVFEYELTTNKLSSKNLIESTYNSLFEE